MTLQVDSYELQVGKSQHYFKKFINNNNYSIT
jgi:hypothetical protein